MNFELDDNQTMLRDSVQRWVASEYDFEARQARLRAAGFDAGCWAAWADMGWFGVGLDETHGGLGGGLADAAVLAEALGHGLVVEPWLDGALLPALLLAAIGDDERLAALQTGERRWVIADAVPAVASPSADELRAVADGDGWRLDGVRTLVVAAQGADALLVSARVDESTAIFELPAQAEGLTRRDYRLINGAAAADLHLDGVRLPAAARLVGQGDALLARLRDTGAVLTAAEMLGAMERALWMTRDYLQTRRQFGVAIGSFQALQHRMADMYMATEQARAAVLRGLAMLELDDDPARAEAAASTKAMVGRSAEFVGAQGIQLHGGIGMTDEYPVGHIFKHLLVLEARHGRRAYHLQRVARALRAAA